MLTQEEVKKIAHLARLGLRPDEIEKFSQQLDSILEYVTILNEVNTDNVEPLRQVTGLANVMRKDEVKPFDQPDALLSCSQLPKERHQIRVKPVMPS